MEHTDNILLTTNISELMAINCVVCNYKQKATPTNYFSTRTSMPRLFQYERERVVGMFQAGMT
jgi:hypothetical protein